MSELSLFGRPARYAGGLHGVADGVHAWLQPNGELGESNAALIVGDGSSLLVDVLWDARLTRAMLDAMAPLVATAPLRTLVLSHSDSDHVFGAGLIDDAVEIVASAEAAEVMRGEDEATAIPRLKSLTGLLAPLRRVVPGAVPVWGDAGVLGAYMAEQLAPFDFTGAVVPRVDREVADTVSLDVGGRAVELRVVGPAHTPGDLIVHVPDAAVVIAADVLFVGVHPVMWAGPVEGWIAALDAIEQTGARVVVPGHGPVGGHDDVHVMRAYFSWLRDEAAPRLAAGEKPLALARSLIADPGFAPSPWGSWDQPQRLAIVLGTMARNAAGGSLPTAIQRVMAFRDAAVLARELQR